MLQGTTLRSPPLSWLPIAPDFRDDLRAALDQAKPVDGLERLAALAAHRLGFLETVQLDRALARLDLKEAPGFQAVRLAVLASSTIDHLPPAIRVAGLRRRLLSLSKQATHLSFFENCVQLPAVRELGRCISSDHFRNQLRLWTGQISTSG